MLLNIKQQQQQQRKDLLVGTLLGDGSLQTGSNGKTWRYRALHQLEQKEYLYHKYMLSKDFCTSEPFISEKYNRIYFNTVVHRDFNEYAELFYNYDVVKGKWVKVVPKEIKDYLTPRALAYFYMDDGALKWLNHSNAMRICSESFTFEENVLIMDVLKDLYNINTKLVKRKLKGNLVGYRISIPEKSSGLFRELIKPYLVDCMKYKVSDGKKGHL